MLTSSSDQGCRLSSRKSKTNMATVETNGITLSYDSFGDDCAETILLIAGLGTQMIRWTAAFCQALTARGYRVIRFDNRDTGCSTHFSGYPVPDFAALAAALAAGQQPVVPYTLRDMAADAIGLLDALAIDQAHFVGRSMGGMIAQIAACEYPSRVLALTSIMSSTGNPHLPSAAPDVMAMMTRRAPDPIEDASAYLKHSMAFARRIASPRFPFDEETYSALMLEETKRAHDAQGFGRQLAAMAVSGDRRSQLASITAPTLVVHGADDPLIPSACGEDTALSIPGAEFLLIDGMGHDLPPELYHVVTEGIERIARRAVRRS